MTVQSKETRNKWLRERMTALGGTPNLAVCRIPSRFLCSVCLIHPLARSLISCFPKPLIKILYFTCMSMTSYADVLNVDSMAAAIMNGQSVSQMRMRYEYVDQENKPENANAITLQTLLGWQTLPFNHVSITGQLINISHLNQDFYDNNMGRNNPSPLPTVQDPEITDINQLFVDYTGVPDSKIRLGRQIIRLDNTRFVGDIIFRQSSQVFDGLTVTNQSIRNTELMFGHYEHLRQSTGKYRDTNIDVAHLAYRYQPKAQAIMYGYFIDQAQTGQVTGVANNAHKNIGVRLDGSIEINPDWRWMHTFEYAKQSTYQGGSPLIDAHYQRIGLGAGYQQWYVRLDQEVLSSNDGLYAFQTPLATLHPFQGWTDLFTTTPRQGIKDQFVTMGGVWSAWTFQTEWHRFTAEKAFLTPNGTGENYGHEWDFSAAFQWNKQWQSKFEYARFHEDDTLGVSPTASTRKADTTKAWVTLLLQF